MDGEKQKETIEHTNVKAGAWSLESDDWTQVWFCHRPVVKPLGNTSHLSLPQFPNLSHVDNNNDLPHGVV